MTDRNAILEALARAIHCHDGRLPTPWDADMIDRWPDDCEYERKVAMSQAAAVLELVGPEPLMWGQRGPQYWAAETVAGMCYILEYPGNAMPFKLDARDYSSHMSRHPTLEAAQSAAQAHADAAHWANTRIGGE